jgi:hypothetical protein
VGLSAFVGFVALVGGPFLEIRYDLEHRIRLGKPKPVVLSGPKD